MEKVFPILSISLLYPKESLTCNFKAARKKRFFDGTSLIASLAIFKPFIEGILTSLRVRVGHRTDKYVDHARPNSHYEAWSYKKKITKRLRHT